METLGRKQTAKKIEAFNYWLITIKKNLAKGWLNNYLLTTTKKLAKLRLNNSR